MRRPKPQARAPWPERPSERANVKLGELIVAFDAKVDKAVDRLRSPAIDTVVYPLSSAADHGLLWHVCGVTPRAVARW